EVDQPARAGSVPQPLDQGAVAWRKSYWKDCANPRAGANRTGRITPPLLLLLVADFLDRVGVVALARDLGFRNGVPRTEAVQHVLPLDHPSEDGVLAVQPFGGKVGEEELRAVGVGPGVRHGEGPPEV